MAPALSGSFGPYGPPPLPTVGMASQLEASWRRLMQASLSGRLRQDGESSGRLRAKPSVFTRHFESQRLVIMGYCQSLLSFFGVWYSACYCGQLGFRGRLLAGAPMHSFMPVDHIALRRWNRNCSQSRSVGEATLNADECRNLIQKALVRCPLFQYDPVLTPTQTARSGCWPERGRDVAMDFRVGESG